MIVGENELIFAKVKPNAIIPSKRDEDAGMDIYACFDEDYMVISPHETKLIPTGIASALSNKYYIQIEERGSTGSKGIKKSAGVIDSGYRNEWFIAITNSTEKHLIISKLSMQELIEKYGKINFFDMYFLDEEHCDVYLREDSTIIHPYSKAIAQAVVHEVPIMNIAELSYQELLMIESERGIGALGSSRK